MLQIALRIEAFVEALPFFHEEATAKMFAFTNTILLNINQ
jgi:hypothetical protein